METGRNPLVRPKESFREVKGMDILPKQAIEIGLKGAKQAYPEQYQALMDSPDRQTKLDAMGKDMIAVLLAAHEKKNPSERTALLVHGFVKAFQTHTEDLAAIQKKKADFAAYKREAFPATQELPEVDYTELPDLPREDASVPPDNIVPIRPEADDADDFSALEHAFAEFGAWDEGEELPQTGTN